MKGLIFNIKRYSIHDGPGIRVTFFMKGCSLSCLWCHNPEGISPLPETVEQVNRIGQKEFCFNEEVGKLYSVENILEIVEKERIFILQSEGGVTFSGGEPMMQMDFLLEALKACKSKEYHTAVDTSGYSTPENFRAVIPYTDLFLFDLKHIDDARHYQLTGVSNSLILSNFTMLAENGKDIMVRIPVIPGFNDDTKSLSDLKKFIMANGSQNLKRISLLPYHKTGTSKYKKFNIPNRMEGVVPPSRERMNELKRFFSETGINVRIGG
jgi:pyruvate formate lyase activating enzyme